MSSPSGPRERELKLLVDPDQLAAVAQSPLLRGRGRGRVTTHHLVGTYFDTVDHRLRRRQLALRVRRDGRRRVQTLKTARDAAAIESERGEWEIEIEGDTPDLSAFGDPRVLELVGLAFPDDLAPVFTTRVERRAFDLAWPSANATLSQIEVALDRGEIEANERSEPISEIELELREGSPSALFEVAADLRRLVPVRLGGSDKSTRGYALATGAPAPASTAPPVTLHRGQPVEEALAAILRGCIAHALANEATAIDGRDIEGVHQVRVAFRRLRSALALFRSAIPETDRRHWQAEARWALGCLGRCRDLDVLLAELLPPLTALRPHDGPLRALAEVAREQREREQLALRENVTSRRWGDLVLELACWTECAGWRRAATIEMLAIQQCPVEELATADLDRGLRRVRKRGRGFKGLDATGRHQLRIALKKLRYGIEFFADLFPEKVVRRYLKATKKLQDRLGHMNDIVVAEHHVDAIMGAIAADHPRRLDAARGGGELIGWHARLSGELERQAFRLWHKLRRLDPFWRSPG